MDSVFFRPWVRTLLIWVGLILYWASIYLPPDYGEPYIQTINGIKYIMQDPIPLPGYYWFLCILAIAFTMTGCYIWTRLKNRHWAFMFWGLLSPIGLLGISLLNNKSTQTVETTETTTQDEATVKIDITPTTEKPIHKPVNPVLWAVLATVILGILIIIGWVK